MKNKISSFSNSSGIFFLFLIFLGTGSLDFTSTCYAQPSWTQKNDMPTARWNLSTCVVNGEIYAIGGMGPVWQAMSSVEQYNPATNTWTKKSDMPTARAGLSSSVVNGKIYAIGGAVIHNYSLDDATFLSTVEEYNPVNNTWTTKTDMPVARGFHSASVINDSIYIIGGSPNIPMYGLLSMYAYDPATDTWTQKGDIPMGIFTGCFTGVVDGKIYVMGGDGKETRVDEYNPATGIWTQKADMPIFTTDQATCVLDGKIYVLGGEAGPPPDYPGKKSVLVYNPSTDRWRTALDMPTGRFGLRASEVDGKIYAIGGRILWTSIAIRTVEEFDPSTNVTGVKPSNAKLPIRYALNQNYPNPFNTTTTITYSITKPDFVILKMYDMLGREIQIMVSEFQNANTYSVDFNAGKLKSGIYLYKLQTGSGYSEVKRMILQ